MDSIDDDPLKLKEKSERRQENSKINNGGNIEEKKKLINFENQLNIL